MDTKTELTEKYRAEALGLMDRLVSEVEKATGLQGKRSEYMDRLSFHISEPSMSIHIEQEARGFSRFRKELTGNAIVIVHLGGYKARYPKRKDGTFNTTKIVKDAKASVEAYREMMERRAVGEAQMAENEALRQAEIGNLVLPEGATATREQQKGTYYFNFKGTFWDLRPGDVAEIVMEIDKLTRKFTFRA